LKEQINKMKEKGKLYNAILSCHHQSNAILLLTRIMYHKSKMNLQKINTHYRNKANGVRKYVSNQASETSKREETRKASREGKKHGVVVNKLD
jgi:hypothetical protein